LGRRPVESRWLTPSPSHSQAKMATTRLRILIAYDAPMINRPESLSLDSSIEPEEGEEAADVFGPG